MRVKVRELKSLRPYMAESPLIEELDAKVRETATAQIESIPHLRRKRK